MKLNKIVLLLLICFSVSIFGQVEEETEEYLEVEEIEDDEQTEDQELRADAEAAKAKFLEANADLKSHLDEAAGYVIFPNVGKGALVVGVSSGNGIVYSNGQVIGYADLKKLDVGLQAGGKALSELIIFKTEDAFERFKNNEFEFAAGASAVALKSGAEANAKYNDGVAVFAVTKAGLMAEASVGGQKFEFKPIY